MPSINVYNISGEVVSKTKLSEQVFASDIYNQAIYDAVRVYRNNTRQDSAKTKKRDEVSGGGRKPYRQKGTGRARQGSTRSPQFRHGGVVFGPTGEQNHKTKQNRKQRTHALVSALTLKAQEGKIIVVDKLNFSDHKTKNAVSLLKGLKLDQGQKIAVVINGSDEKQFYNVATAFNNIPGVVFSHIPEFLSTYPLLTSQFLLIDLEGLKALEEGLNG
jgi:large subunit ribosomal protein L4